MADTGLSFGSSTTSAKSISYGAISNTLRFETTNGDCKVYITAITNPLSTTEFYGDLTFTYTLENDREEDASLKPYYSSTGPSGTFIEMTDAGGDSEGKDNLSTSAEGESHTFIWDTVTDLGIDFNSTVWIKFVAYDRTAFIGDTMNDTGRFINVNNAPEACILTAPVDGWFDKNTTPQVVGTIPDMRAGDSDAHIKLEIASDSGFTDIQYTYESAVVQTGWEYDSTGAGGWVDIPDTGIPVSSTPALVGNSWRYTIQTEDELDEGNWYVRARVGGVL